MTKAFGEREVLRGIDLDRARARGGRADRRLGLGQVDAAALHRPARGDRRRRRLPRRRGDHRPVRRPGRASGAGSGIVFQAYNLFPHLTVLENVVLGAGARARRAARARPRTRARELLARFGLDGPRGRPPRPALRRPAAAGRDRPRAGRPARARCCSTRSRARSTPSWSARCSTLVRELKARGDDDADRHARDGLRRARSPTRSASCTRAAIVERGTPAADLRSARARGDAAVPAPPAGGRPALIDGGWTTTAAAAYGPSARTARSRAPRRTPAPGTFAAMTPRRTSVPPSAATRSQTARSSSRPSPPPRASGSSTRLSM